MKTASEIIDKYFSYNEFDKKRVVAAMEEYALQQSKEGYIKGFKKLFDRIWNFILVWVTYSIYYFATAFTMWVAVKLINMYSLTYWQCLGTVILFRFFIGIWNNKPYKHLEAKFKRKINRELKILLGI